MKRHLLAEVQYSAVENKQAAVSVPYCCSKPHLGGNRTDSNTSCWSIQPQRAFKRRCVTPGGL